MNSTGTKLFAALLAATFVAPTHADNKPIKAFILAGQSNMVGWGDSTKLPGDLRKGNDRVLMFENGKWQPLRPHEPGNLRLANCLRRRFWNSQTIQGKNSDANFQTR